MTDRYYKYLHVVAILHYSDCRFMKELFRPFIASFCPIYSRFMQGVYYLQWKLDLADADLVENLDLKDTLYKIWVTIFDF